MPRMQSGKIAAFTTNSAARRGTFARGCDCPHMMKIAALTFLAVACGTLAEAPARAELTPRDTVRTEQPAMTDDAALYHGPIGAMLEANYFQMPATQSASSALCRLHLYFSQQPLTYANLCR